MSFLSNPQRNEVEAPLRMAILRLLKEDSELFNFQVNERTITQRLAGYLEHHFAALGLGLKVDCEYNRMWIDNEDYGINLKKQYPQLSDLKPSAEDTDGVTVFPDIIVHIRGRQFVNILVIEAKRNAVAGTVPDNDYIKLHEFTKLDGRFRYPWGIFLNFRSFPSPCNTPNKTITLVDLVWFRRGEEAGSDQIRLV